MFERFTKPARKVVVLAHEEAQILRHECIGCEHMLLGLVHQETGLAARLFESLDITVERVRAQVLQTVGPAREATSGDIPFTRQATKALELSLHESLSLGHSYVGSEHILLGLLHDEEGLASSSLSLLESDAQRVTRAAKQTRRAGERVALAGPAQLTEFARVQIEMQAAIRARNFERAAKLHSRSSTLKLFIGIGTGRSTDEVVLERVRALLA